MKYPLEKIVKIYRLNANPALVFDMERYMKNQFSFLGIKSPLRRELNAAFIKEQGKPDINEIAQISEYLWSREEREFQYLAMEILKRFKKKWKEEHIHLFEYLIENRSWWDTVDFIAAHLAGSYFDMYPEKIDYYNSKWINHELLWFRRSALLFQLKYKASTDLEILTRNIHKTKHEKEFFIEKAIGWVLREYSKTNPEWVQAFVEENKIRPLSIRESLKWIYAQA